MTTIVLASLLAAWLAQDAPSDGLRASCLKLAQAESYAFELSTEDAGGFGGPSGAVAGKVSGRFQKGSAVQLERGEYEAFRMDETMVYRTKGGEGAWEIFDQSSFFGGGGARGGPGEGGPGRGGPGRGGPDRRSQMEVFSLATIPIPHVALSDIESLVSDVSREAKDQKIVYSGTLSAKGAEEFSGASRWRAMRERFGGGGEGPEASGTLRVTTDSEGRIETIEIETKTHFSFGERSIDRERKMTFRLTGFGKTDVAVPAEVLAKLKSS